MTTNSELLSIILGLAIFLFFALPLSFSSLFLPLFPLFFRLSLSLLISPFFYPYLHFSPSFCPYLPISLSSCLSISPALSTFFACPFKAISHQIRLFLNSLPLLGTPSRHFLFAGDYASHSLELTSS